MTDMIKVYGLYQVVYKIVLLEVFHESYKTWVHIYGHR